MKSRYRETSCLAAALVAAAGLVWWGAAGAMGDKEPELSAADTSAAEQKGKVPSSNPLSGDPEAIELGKSLYYTWCVQCHGHKANGESRFGKYAGDLTHFWRGYKEFVVIVKNGRVDKMMPPWKDVLDEDNINKVGAFLETLAEEGANWK
ncbi:MAG TPA: c-type cytochrome [Burkholderiales bacterium]|jgi:cytochrome c oxidase cbb3-type subunit 3